jgi:hypothetical protein
MSSRSLVAGLPLVAGSALISLAVLNLVFSEGFFMLEWMGAFLVFYGLSYLGGPRMAMALSGVVLVAGSLGDIVLMGGVTPLNWTMANYMVFVHAVLGSLAGRVMREFTSGKG